MLASLASDVRQERRALCHEEWPAPMDIHTIRRSIPHPHPELRSCVKVEVAVQDSPSLTVLVVSVDVKPVLNWANVCSPNILRTLRRTMMND